MSFCAIVDRHFMARMLRPSLPRMLRPSLPRRPRPSLLLMLVLLLSLLLAPSAQQQQATPNHVDWEDSRAMSLLHAVLSTDDTSVDDAHGCGSPGAVLSLLEKATNGTGELVVKLDPPQQLPQDATITSVTLAGLDSLSSADVLNAAGAAVDHGQSLQSSLVFDWLNLTVHVEKEGGGDFSVVVDMHDQVELDVTVELNVSSARVAGLRVEQLARPGCLASTVDGSKVTALTVSADRAHCGGCPPPEHLSHSVCEGLVYEVCQVVTGSQQKVSHWLASEVGKLPSLLGLLENPNATCPTPAEIEAEEEGAGGGSDQYVDFTAANTTFAALEAAVFGEKDAAAVGHAVACAASSPGAPFGGFAVPGPLSFGLVSPISLGSLSLSLSDLEVRGLGSLDVLSLLVPTAPHGLASRVAFPGPLHVQVVVTVADAAATNAVGGKLALNLTIRKADLRTAAYPVLFDAARFGRLSLGQLQNPETGLACVLSAFDALTLTKLGLHLGAYGSGDGSGDEPGLSLSFTPVGPYSSAGLGSQTWGPVDLAPLVNGLLNGSSPHSAALVNALLLGPAIASANATCHGSGGNASADGRRSGDNDEDDMEVIQDDALELDIGLWQMRSLTAAAGWLVFVLCCGCLWRLTRCGHVKGRSDGLVSRQSQRHGSKDHAGGSYSSAPFRKVSSEDDDDDAALPTSSSGGGGVIVVGGGTSPFVATTAMDDPPQGAAEGAHNGQRMFHDIGVGGGGGGRDHGASASSFDDIRVSFASQQGGRADGGRANGHASGYGNGHHGNDARDPGGLDDNDNDDDGNNNGGGWGAAGGERPRLASFASSSGGGVGDGGGGGSGVVGGGGGGSRGWVESLKGVYRAHAARHAAVIRSRKVRTENRAGGGGGGGSSSSSSSGCGPEFYRDGAVTNVPPSYTDVDCLCLSPRISPAIFIAFPAAVCAVIFLFIISNTATSSVDVYMHIEVGDFLTFDTPSFFIFTLKSSVDDMWDAGVYPLAAAIAIFSCGWPYLKMALLLVAWVMPLQVGRREKLLHWIDVLGKWSLLDTYVMALMQVAFNFNIFLASGELRLTVYTTPRFGFVSFLFATALSLFAGHCGSFLHRLAASPLSRIPSAGPKESVMRHRFFVLEDQKKTGQGGLAADGGGGGGSGGGDNDEDDEGENNNIDGTGRTRATKSRGIGSGIGGANDDGDDDDEDVVDSVAGAVVSQRTVQVTWGCNMILQAVFGLTCATVILGFVVHSFIFEFGGLTGWVLKYVAGPGSSDNKKAYSLYSTFAALPGSQPRPQDLSVLLVQAVFIIFSFAMPMLVIVLLAVLWRAPLTLRRQAELLWLAEVTMCWSAVDVFIFSVVVALTEIQQFSAFIIEDPCDSPVLPGGQSIDDATAAFFKQHGIKGWDAECLIVETQLYKGCYALGVAGVVHFIVSEMFFFVAQKAVKERIEHRRLLEGKVSERKRLLSGASSTGSSSSGRGGGGGLGGDPHGFLNGDVASEEKDAGESSSRSGGLRNRHARATSSDLYAPLLGQRGGNEVLGDGQDDGDGDRGEDDEDEEDEEGNDEGGEGEDDDDDEEEAMRRTTWGALVGFHPMAEGDVQEGASAGCCVG